METFKEFFVKSLKFYSYEDYFSDVNIRYRSIFYYPHTKFITSELTLVNKYYGFKDWNLELVLKLDQSYSYDDQPFLEKTIKKFVKKDETEIKITEDIRLKNVMCGTYFSNEFSLSFYCDDDLVELNDFIVYYNNDFSRDYNPFFEITSVKMSSEKSEQQSVFSQYTNHIYMTLDLNYLFEERYLYEDDPDFMKCEIFFVLRNEAGEKINEHCEDFEMFWSDHYDVIDLNITSMLNNRMLIGDYTIDVIFAGCSLRQHKFKIDNYDDILDDGYGDAYKIIESQIDRVTYEDFVSEELYEFVGLEEIKKEIKKIEDYVQFKKGTKDFYKGNNPNLKFHFIFSGNPGTGKTKLALKLGRIFRDMGILSKGSVSVVSRNNLVGRVVGETALKTAKQIEDARGGILFIDDAYSLFKDKNVMDYGIEAIEILLKEMSDGKGDLIVIAAGYPKEMDLFLKSNPGLASRFKYHFNFPDFSKEELLQIAVNRARKKHFTVSNEAFQYLEKKINKTKNLNDDKFGNARFIINIVDKAEINFSSRLMENNTNPIIQSVPLVFEKEDFEGLFEDSSPLKKHNFSVNEYSFNKALEKLNKLTGLGNIKREITELAKILKYYREENIDFNNKISLHSVFKGNPGTGKTTVARIISTLYKSLGLLEKGHLVECDRAGLVAEYIGHTAIKTNQLIDKAMGGVLFIDEAYSLYKGDSRDFGNEAIETLLKRMEDSRGKFVVICAGYSDEMEEFLRSNPGLKSRFDRIYEFKDYSSEELLEIAMTQFKARGLEANNVLSKLMQLINLVSKKRDKYFGNAREIRNLTSKISLKHDLRLANLDKKDRTDEVKRYLIDYDLDIKLNIPLKDNPPIGFQ